jgi:hypothetical protein
MRRRDKIAKLFCAEGAGFDVQLHIRESIPPSLRAAPWIPSSLAQRKIEVNLSRACAPE